MQDQHQEQRQRWSADAESETDALAAKETRGINILRMVTLGLLVTIATLFSVGVHFYATYYEKEKFEDDFATNAERIVVAFQQGVEHKLVAINGMADAITSHAISSGEEFPRVTLPNFAVHGSNMRIQSSATVVQWTPLVTDDTRIEWEEYALANRFQFDEASEQDTELRNRQDEHFGLSLNYTSNLRPLNPNDTVLDDGTNFHPRIYSNGAVTPRGDEPNGTGPYLPVWQRRWVKSFTRCMYGIPRCSSEYLQTFFSAAAPTFQRNKSF